MDRVSVIIPTHNRAGLIRETLDSVLAQTWGDYEIVVVDDGSEDDTAGVLAELGGRVIYRRIEHAGAGAARNVGLEMARGEFVAFLDSDDVWDARFMEKMLAALRQASWAGLAYCDYATFDDRGVIQAACLAPNEKIRGSLFPKLIERDFLCTGSLLIRRTCLEQAGRFDPGLAVAHDWDMWLRLAWRNDAEYLDEPLLRIRFHPGNLSRNAQQVHTDNLRILAKLRRDLQAKRFHPAIRTTALRSHRALFSHYRRTRRPLSALKQLGLMAVVRFL